MTKIVNEPDHYTWHPVAECVDIASHFSYNIGNAIKYLWRQGRKDDRIQDLEKARRYIQYEIWHLQSLTVTQGRDRDRAQEIADKTYRQVTGGGPMPDVSKERVEIAEYEAPTSKATTKRQMVFKQKPARGGFELYDTKGDLVGFAPPGMKFSSKEFSPQINYDGETVAWWPTPTPEEMKRLAGGKLGDDHGETDSTSAPEPSGEGLRSEQPSRAGQEQAGGPLSGARPQPRASGAETSASSLAQGDDYGLSGPDCEEAGTGEARVDDEGSAGEGVVARKTFWPVGEQPAYGRAWNPLTDAVSPEDDEKIEAVFRRGGR